MSLIHVGFLSLPTAVSFARICLHAAPPWGLAFSASPLCAGGIGHQGSWWRTETLGTYLDLGTGLPEGIRSRGMELKVHPGFLTPQPGHFPRHPLVSPETDWLSQGVLSPGVLRKQSAPHPTPAPLLGIWVISPLIVHDGRWHSCKHQTSEYKWPFPFGFFFSLGKSVKLLG